MDCTKVIPIICLPELAIFFENNLPAYHNTCKTLKKFYMISSSPNSSISFGKFLFRKKPFLYHNLNKYFS